MIWDKAFEARHSVLFTISSTVNRLRIYDHQMVRSLMLLTSCIMIDVARQEL